MNDRQAEIARLKTIIAQQETQLTTLEAEIIDLERDLSPITTRFKRIIDPKLARLDIIKRMIADIESELAQSQTADITPDPNPLAWKPPSNYVSVEEQYRQTWEVPRQQAPNAPPRMGNTAETFFATERHANSASDASTIKLLYRQLARRYHPDLATDPIEREHRNRLMAEINAAYADNDLDALRALASQPETVQVSEPLESLQLRQLQQIQRQLDRRLDELRKERHDLQNGDMMWIKVQVAFAAREKRDYLQEMANRLDDEYSSLLDRLDELKRQL